MISCFFLRHSFLPTQMKKQDSKHEVIVLGSGLGGLLAGTLLAAKKHSVLILKEKEYQPFYEREGYRFVPFSNFSERNLKRSILQKISQELGLSLIPDGSPKVSETRSDLKKQQNKVDYQVILPKARVDLFDQRTLLQREWKREFPNEVIEIEKFYDEMKRVRQLLSKSRRIKNTQDFFPLQLRSLIKRWLPFKHFAPKSIDEKLSVLSKEFREFIKLQLISQGNLYSEKIPFSLAAYLLSNNEPGEWISDEDLEILKESILERFFQSGGKIEEIDRIERIDKKWRKSFTLSLKGDQNSLQSSFLILNSPLHRFSNLWGKKGKRLSKWAEKIQPRYVLIPFFFGIREKVVPVGMKDLLVSILDLNKPYERGNVLFLSLSPKGDKTEAPEGKRALTIQYLMPWDEWDALSLAEHQEGVMRHLKYLFPFLEKYIEFIEFSWANEQISHWSYPHFLYETKSDFHWREGVVPTRISRNLYFIGKENFPYLGLEGEILSGLMVAQQILQKFS